MCFSIRVPSGTIKFLLTLIAFSAFQQPTAVAQVKEATRIVSLGPDVTEIIYALGAGDKIIAVDRSSKYPSEATDKTNVGYRRSLSPEGILTLNTDLIIASEDIGPPEATDVLTNQLSRSSIFQSITVVQA